MKSKYSWLLLSGFIIIFDQITKYLIRARFELYDSIQIIGDLVRFTYVRNTGAAFSLSFGNVLVNRIIFIAVTLIAIVVMFLYLRKTKNNFESAIISMILGGAVGNLIDRISLGYVTDFIDCDFPDFVMTRFPVFNVADSSISIAIALLIIYILFFDKNVKIEDKNL